MDFVASEVCGGVKMKQRSSWLIELKEVRADSKPVEGYTSESIVE